MNLHHEPMVEAHESPRAATLREYAETHHITEDKVWELIEEGELSARFVNDTILIYREPEPTLLTSSPEPKLSSDPDPSMQAPFTKREAPSQPSQTLAVNEEADDERELDSNQGLPPPAPTSDSSEWLIFAQDLLGRTMDLSQQLLATKDELLRLRDEKIQWLEKQLLDKDQEIRRLRRELENFAILQNISRNPHLLRDGHRSDP